MSHGGSGAPSGHGGGYLHGAAPDQSASWNMAVQQVTNEKPNNGQYSPGLGIVIGALIAFVILCSLPYVLDKIQERSIIQHNKNSMANTQPATDNQQNKSSADGQVNSNPLMSNAFGEIGNVVASVFGLKSMSGTGKNQGNNWSLPSGQETGNAGFQTAESESMTQSAQSLAPAPATNPVLTASVNPYPTPLPGFRTDVQGYQVYLPNAVQRSYVQPSVAQVPINQQSYYPGNSAPNNINLGNIAITSPMGVRGNGQYDTAVVSSLRQEAPSFTPPDTASSPNVSMQMFSQLFGRHGHHMR